jgi:hypothetical protein
MARTQESITTMPRHGLGNLCPIAMASLLAASAPGALLAADSDRALLPPISAQARAEQLVAQLGAASYDRREQAENLLQQIGAAALPSLRDAISHSDLEIRYRAQDLLERIELVEQTRILREFLSSGDPALGELLHGWERFARLVGEDFSARALFANMHQEEPEIMRLCDRSGTELSNLVEERSLQFRSSSRRAATAGMSPATLAVFLFVMLDPNTELSGGANSLMSVVLRQSEISDTLSEGNSAFRRLMARWIADADEVPPSQRVHVAVTYSLETGVVPALELIRSQARGSQIQNAIFAIAKLGGPDHLADLEPLLFDDSVLAEHQQGNTVRHLPSKVREVARHLAEFNAQQYVDAQQAEVPEAGEVAYSSLVCDVALVAMIHLTGQNPYDYGFAKLRSNKEFYEHNTAGFDSQQQRERALSQWGLWCKVQRLQSREIDETAVEGVQL